MRSYRDKDRVGRVEEILFGYGSEKVDVGFCSRRKEAAWQSSALAVRGMSGLYVDLIV